MATNINGVTLVRPTSDPAIAASGNFLLGGAITTAGGGGWAESGDMYFQWDQGTGNWVDLASTGELNIAAQTNPVTGLQTTAEQQVTVYSNGTDGTYQVRIKLIEDDLTEYTTAGQTVTVGTGGSTTVAPTTLAPTTLAPTTLAPTTLAPTTLAPTTLAPTTLAPTTLAPTTLAPTTPEPTTLAPTTLAPTTLAPTTLAPTTLAPTTLAPTTPEPTTLAPTTLAPTTLAPTTVAPTTIAPTTDIIYTNPLDDWRDGQPVIQPGADGDFDEWRDGQPIIELEGTPIPKTTLAPTTVAPTTLAPTTLAPTTLAPTTLAPTTLAPTTSAPTTLAPTTLAPTTAVPTTVAPTTLAPTTPSCDSVNSFWETPVGTWLFGASATGANFRHIISSGDISHSINGYVRVTFVGTSGHTLLGASIGPRLSNDDFSDTPTRLTFGGSNGGTFNASNELVSDWVVYDLDNTIDHLVHARYGIDQDYGYSTTDTVVAYRSLDTNEEELDLNVSYGSRTTYYAVDRIEACVFGTLAPTTLEPTTLAPTTLAPTTLAPTTIAPTTSAPTTLAPTTIAPTTLAPTTLAPTTLAPTTIAPTTTAPTTLAPTTVPPSTCPPSTYSTNFGGANELDDWTEEWQAASTSLSVVDSDADQKVGTKALRLTAINSNRKFISYDPAGTSEDQEILALINLQDIYNVDQGFRLHLRSSGSEGSENGYFLNFYGLTDYVDIYKYVGGVSNRVGSTNTFEFFNTDKLGWFRFRVEGTSIKFKFWSATSFEPVEWAIEETDSDLSSGKLGIGAYNADTVDIEYFACGVCGGSPSVPALTDGAIDGYINKVLDATTNTNITWARLFPFIIGADADGKYIHKIGIYFTTSNESCRIALYKGSDKTDPTDAVLVEDFGKPSSLTADAWNYFYLSSPEIVSENDVFYIGLKGDSTYGYDYLVYHDDPVIGNIQLANGSGRWDISVGESASPDSAWSANLSGDTIAQAAFWYAADLYIRDDQTTPAPTTVASTTAAPTTSAPTTAAPTTVYPSTVPPTTVHVASTPPPTTSAPTTLAPTTLEPTTLAPTTLAPTTLEPTTLAPTTLAPTTLTPTTLAPTTVAPTTGPPCSSTRWRLYVDDTEDGNDITLPEMEMFESVGGSDVCSGGTVTESAHGPFSLNPGEDAFDDSLSSFWNSDAAPPQWVEYEFASAKTIVQYSIQCSSYNTTQLPMDFRLQYWNGVSWVTVDTQTGQTGWYSGLKRTYTTDCYDGATTAAPTTLAATTVAPTTVSPTTAIATTVAPTTLAPSTSAPTTLEATTPAPTTLAPTTLPSSTGAPTTVSVTTVVPTTVVPSTLAPTTVPATTLTTAVPTTPPPVVCTHTEYSLIVDEDTIDSLIVDSDTLISLITDTDELESVIC